MIFGRQTFPPRLGRFLVMVHVVSEGITVAWGYWTSLQVGHRGKYSVERLLSFRDYYVRTSPTRVLIVCATGLLPAFIVAILVEFIPLKPPDEGWRANYAFWVRLYVSSLPIAFGGVYQVKEVIEPGAISTTGIVTTAVGSCTCYVALSIAVAALWKFPIPFGYVLTVGPFVAFYMVFFMLSIGPRVLASSQVLRRQIFSQMLVIAAQGMLAIAYPTFGAVFNQLSGHEQTAFVFVLPVIKFCVKQFVAKASAHLHEYVGPTVVLSVDVCNVLYVAICVQTAISPITTTLVIALDAAFVLLAFRSIYRQSHVTQARVSASLTSLPKSNYVQNLIALVRQTFQLARAVDALPTPIRIRAPFPLPLSDESSNYMRSLISATENNAQEVEVAADESPLIPCEDPIRGNGDGDQTPALTLLHRVLNDRRIAPAPDSAQCKPPPILIRLSKVFLPSHLVQSNSPKHATIHSRYQAASSNVQDGLQALFHSEYVVMGEFVECVTPVLYAVYLAVLYHLPTAAYYPHTRSLTTAKFASTETNLMLYALIELSLFVGLNVLLRRKFGFFPLYQLAFVFETHARILQSHLFVWVLCILQITLVHNEVFQSVWGYWNRVQVGHRGRYSVERLLALNDYYQRTSLAHVVVVCSLGLLPAFVVAVLVECIPLRPPTESWRANYTFWIRLFVSSLPIAFGGVYQVKEVIQPGVISRTGIIATAFGSCACYVALTILVAALWKFPIPFGYVLTIGPFVFFYMVFFLLSIGPRVLANSPALRRQIFSQILVIAAQGLLAIAYPTFGAIFKQLSGHQQTAFVFVLPIIKFSIKQFIATVSSHLHEYVGPTVVLSVDVCNVLYVSICVQTAISPLTSALLIGSDAFFVVLALRSIYNQSDVARARRRLLSSSSRVPLKINYLLDLMGLLRDAFQCSPAAPVPIRVRAPFPLVLSTESAMFMNALVRSSQQVGGEVDYSGNLHTVSTVPTAGAARIGTCHQEVPTVPDWIVLNDALHSALAVGPSHPDAHRVTPAELRRDSKLNQLLRVSYDKAARSSIHRISSTASRGEPSHQEDAVKEVQDELQSLFHSEYVVMAEFIECFIPVLYAVYLACLYHLPTAEYYPHTRSLTPEKFVSTEINLMLYGLVELASFVAMNLLLQRKFGFSPLYQLAFVFETQVRTLQSHLFVWILCILQTTLVHNGKGVNGDEVADTDVEPNWEPACC